MAQTVWSVMTARRRGSGSSAQNVESVWPSNVNKISFVFFETSSGSFEVYGFNLNSGVTPMWKWTPGSQQDLTAVWTYLASLVATGPTEGPVPPPGHPPGSCTSPPTAVSDAATKGADAV
jgi:hypothetical protein